jgi:hypothetical protein
MSDLVKQEKCIHKTIMRDTKNEWCIKCDKNITLLKIKEATIKEIIKFVKSYYYKPNKDLIQVEAVVMKCKELLGEKK